MRKFLNCLLVVIVFVGCLATNIFAQEKNKNISKKASFKKTDTPKVNSTTASNPLKQLNTNERLVEIITDYGIMIAKLYDSTPLHRDNFLKLVENKFYDSLLFHRVIDKFMIQGGDPTSKNAANGASLGSGSINGDRIPAEFKPCFFHKKGALAAARDNNPEKASSNCQFYIVEGITMLEQELENVYNQRVKTANASYTYTKTQKEIYHRIGGTPFLDQSYTVFGEVISGLDVIDKIAKAPKDAADRPLQNIRMKIRLLN